MELRAPAGLQAASEPSRFTRRDPGNDTLVRWKREIAARRESGLPEPAAAHELV